MVKFAEVQNFELAAGSKSTITSAPSSGTSVMYEGSVVDVEHTMKLLATLQNDLLAKQQAYADSQAQLRASINRQSIVMSHVFQCL